jgi:hypothetical protein
MTIKQELEQIANVCITSQEFTERAKSYLKNEKGIKQAIMSDVELRDIYRTVERNREVEKCWEKYENTIRPALIKRPDCKNLWYECWIDLSECWEEKWFASFRFMKDEQIIEVCVKYLNEQERFYDSTDYIDMLDKMVENAEWN